MRRRCSKYAVDYSTVREVRHFYRYVRSGGERAHIAGNRSAFHGRYRQAGLPLFEAGSTLEVIDDDGSSEFAEFYSEIERHGVLFGRIRTMTNYCPTSHDWQRHSPVSSRLRRRQTSRGIGLRPDPRNPSLHQFGRHAAQGRPPSQRPSL